VDMINENKTAYRVLMWREYNGDGRLAAGWV
jgi:hypothetical protein